MGVVGALLRSRTGEAGDGVGEPGTWTFSAVPPAAVAGVVPSVGDGGGGVRTGSMPCAVHTTRM